MPVYVDQLNRNVAIVEKPQRIVSVVPSQTELLFHLGLTTEVTGITKFCIHPQEWFRQKTRIGGTKNLQLQKIKELKPDLIIANKEENVKEQVDELANEFPVWVSDINNLADAIAMIKMVGAITGKAAEGLTLVNTISQSFAQLQQPVTQLRTAYLIWKDPYMTVGSDTFIHNMLLQAGFINMFQNLTRYPVITTKDLTNCELLLLSSEPYPFKQKHIDALQQQLPHTKIILVDGEMFSWYGSRLQHAPAYFRQLQNHIEAIL